MAFSNVHVHVLRGSLLDHRLSTNNGKIQGMAHPLQKLGTTIICQALWTPEPGSHNNGPTLSAVALFERDDNYAGRSIEMDKPKPLHSCEVFHRPQGEASMWVHPQGSKLDKGAPEKWFT